MWRPRFLKDENKRINVPAMRFTVPSQDGMTFNLTFGTKEALNQVLAMPISDRDEEKQYIRELLKDTLRYEKLYKKLNDCNKTDAIEVGMKRAFGDNLTTMNEPKEFKEYSMQSYIGLLGWQRGHMFEFKHMVLK